MRAKSMRQIAAPGSELLHPPRRLQRRTPSEAAFQPAGPSRSSALGPVGVWRGGRTHLLPPASGLPLSSTDPKPEGRKASRGESRPNPPRPPCEQQALRLALPRTTPLSPGICRRRSLSESPAGAPDVERAELPSCHQAGSKQREVCQVAATRVRGPTVRVDVCA